ncbi:MAG: hypothetical protein GYA21_00565 [Myxococcales bacterium]|nr:hypothetical protein [Myxococcales bacterium]
MRAMCAGLVLVMAVVWCAPTYAADPARKKEAKTHFSQGEKFYRLGKFQEALSEYSKAYEILPLPGFLFNIGQCHRMLDDHERAVFFFKGYLREQPRAKNRKQVEALIAECERKLAEGKKAEEARLAEERRAAEEARQREEEQKKAEQALALERLRLEAARTAAPPPPPVPSLPAPEAGEPFYKKWWFWTIAGAIIAGAAAGTYFAVRPAPSPVNPSGSLGTVVW